MKCYLSVYSNPRINVHNMAMILGSKKALGVVLSLLCSYQLPQTPKYEPCKNKGLVSPDLHNIPRNKIHGVTFLM